LFVVGMSFSTASCGTLLGAEDEYVLGASGASGSSSGGSSNAGSGGLAGAAGASAAGQAGAAGTGAVGGLGGGSAGVGGVAGQAGAAGLGGAAGLSGGGQGGSAGFGGTITFGGNAGAAGAGQSGASGAAGAGLAGAGGSLGGSAGSGGGGTGGAGGNAGSAGLAGAGGGAGEGGSAGTSTGGSAGTSSGGSAGSSAGAGGASGGAAGQSGAAGSGGAPDGPCCEQEVAAVLAGLEAQYSNLANTPAYGFTPPSNSKCYTYGTLAENQGGTIRFGAKSLLPSCNDLALQVTGYDASKSAELVSPVSGACAASGQNATAVNASVSFCPGLKKIACTTAIFQGPDAVTAAACTAEVCKQCQIGGVADINKWLDSQRTFYTTNKKLNIALVAPTDTPCYDYQIIYNQAVWINLAAVAKNAACTNLAARAESSATTIEAGVCTVPSGAAFNGWLSGAADGVIDDCEIPNGSGMTAPIRCEGASQPVAGTTSVAANACP
jgi:hypothetical protein